MNKTKIFYHLLMLLFITSCAENKQDISYLPVKETTDTYDLDGNEMIVIKNIKMSPKKFINTVTNDTVSILHHLDNTGFHFYNGSFEKTPCIFCCTLFKYNGLGAILL